MAVSWRAVTVPPMGQVARTCRPPPAEAAARVPPKCPPETCLADKPADPALRLSSFFLV